MGKGLRNLIEYDKDLRTLNKAQMKTNGKDREKVQASTSKVFHNHFQGLEELYEALLYKYLFLECVALEIC